MKKKLYIVLLFQMLVISAFGITVTATAPNTGVSKVMTVDNGKVYELNFYTDVLSSSVVEVNIKELGSTIASQQISTNGNNALTFTPTSNAITIEFNRINSGTASLKFEVDNIQLKEVVSSKLTHKVGIKNYELSDHLGNVRTTVSDKKVSGSSKVISANDYYPFGMEARNVSNGDYRYGFNGMEKDDEMTEGNYDFGARIYDSRLGRWLAVDAMYSKYADFNPYNYTLNSPLAFEDPDGNDVYLVIWFTASGETGHAGIAVDNYHEVVKNTYDAQGNITKTEKIWEPDGTVTYFDHWPGDTDGDGDIDDDDDGVGKGNSDVDVGAYMNYETNIKLDDLKNKDIGIGEEMAAHGLIRITTDKDDDDKLRDTYKNAADRPKKYNGQTFNCSDFAQKCVNSLGKMTVDGTEKITHPGNNTPLISMDPINMESVTPNYLFKAVKEVVENDPSKGKVEKGDSNTDQDLDFLNGKTHGFISDSTPGT